MTAPSGPGAAGPALAGEQLLTLEIGPVAHGGHCVARHEGRVVFVRHSLPGELVLARVEQGDPDDRFWRADAVEVLRPSPDRVSPPCPLSGPGRCGGCDWQHARPEAQRRLKAAVVEEQVRRLAGVELTGLVVEPVPGDDDGLGWRTRVRFTVDEQGRPGFRGHRSHQIVPVPDCPIAHPEVNRIGVGTRRWPGVSAIEVVVSGPAAAGPVQDEEPDAAGAARSAEPPDGNLDRTPDRTLDGPPDGTPGAGSDADRPEPQRLLVVEPLTGPGGRPVRVELPPLPVEVSVARRGPDGLQRIRGRTWVQEAVRVGSATRRFRVSGSGFWQVHPGAAQALLDAVLEATDPQPGECAADLYCGAGLFTAALAARVGPTGRVVGVEADPRAAADARRSLHDLPRVRLEEGPVQRVLPRLERPDVVVLDPPRAGAGRRVIEAIVQRRPRVIAYVACDPAALARDLALAATAGYRLAGLRAFDLFPMTHHVECVATLRRAESGPR